MNTNTLFFITCDHPFKYLDYSGRLHPVVVERLNMQHTKPKT